MNQNIKMKKEYYTILNILFFIVLLGFIPETLSNYTNSEFVFWLIEIPMMILSYILIKKSFHTTKQDIYALAFVFGDCIGELHEGMSYVPFGFMSGAVQDYTTADFSINEVINVIKMKEVQKVKNPEIYSFTFSDNTEVKQVVDYKMHIKFEGAIRIKPGGALNFFRKTGLSELKPGKLNRDDQPFYNNVMSDLSSDFNNIAIKWGYLKFRERTDWDDPSDITKEAERVTERPSTLEETLDEYGLEIGKLSTYTKLEGKLESELTNASTVLAARGPAQFKAGTDRLVAEQASEAKKFDALKQAEAKAVEVEKVGEATTKAVTKSIDEYSSRGYGKEAAMQQAALDNDSYANENLTVLTGPNGESLQNLLMGAPGVNAANADAMIPYLVSKFSLTDQLKAFMDKVSAADPSEKKDIIRKALTS